MVTGGDSYLSEEENILTILNTDNLM